MSTNCVEQPAKRADVVQLKEQIKVAKSLCTMDKEETLQMRLAHVGPSCTLFFKENPLKMVQGRGQYLYDHLGAEYLDCINNVSHVGHGNPRVAASVARQLSLLNTNSRFLHESLALYARRLTATFPAHLSVCYLVNSGSEANDLAIRLARAHTKRKDIVSLDGAYHGNLTSTMAISPYKTDHLVNHKPAKWAHVAPLPCAYRGIYARATSKQHDPSGKQDEKEEEDEDEEDLSSDETLGRLYADASWRVIEKAQARGRQVAAFFVESMISCGGQTPLPPGYLRHLQAHLHRNGSLLVCDEVQTGFGRSGERMWAFQLDEPELEGGDSSTFEAVRPDIVTLGKPMGNGFPVAAVVTTAEVAASFLAIGTEYFNTFGGNPASCAAAMAVLDEIEERQLMKQAREVGAYVLRELHRLKRKSRFVGDVRGRGLFIGLEMVENLSSKAPAPQYAQFLVARLRDERILLSTEGKLGNVLKFKPPMVFDLADARRLVEALERALVELELQVATSGNQQRSSTTSSSSSFSSSASSSSSWLESSGELEV